MNTATEMKQEKRVNKTDFSVFSHAVRDQFELMSEHELYLVDADRDEIWSTYLGSFPEGSNEIFRERTEHDCSCCKSFIRNIGPVIAIINGTIQSVWDVLDVGHPYDEVTQSMAAYVKSRPIKRVYRTPESVYGAESTPELINGTVHNWNHFVGKIDKRYSKPSDAIGVYNSKIESTYQVFKRGLDELKSDAFDTVIDLMLEGSIYRGDEFKASVSEFRQLQAAYLGYESKEIFIWMNIENPAARFRNTAIGTLLVDLSEGVGIEKAVKSFESKVAPANYKRPTALITKKMIEDAMSKLDELGLRPAVDRRHATISDVSVNDVLFVDNSVAPLMQDSLSDMLMEEVKPVKVDIKNATDISIDDFIASVLPKCTGIDALVQNKHLSNFMTVTAPVHADSGELFSWGNNFAWSYDGDMADSDMRRAVVSKGGRVDGVMRFTHSWNYSERNASLMDLHVFMPNSGISAGNPVNDHYGNKSRVGWNNRNHGLSGGVQDVDYVDAAPSGYVPVENITFPDLGKMPDGEYICKIHNWNKREPNKGGFKAEIEFAGSLFEYEHIKPLGNKQWVTVAVLTKKDDEFTIAHSMDHSSSQKTKWGITTESLVPVDTMILSPNHWNGKSKGNKHFFFLLKDCKNPDPVRGIYNEFLKSELTAHRKVFEVLGSKTKCQPSDDQLSGIGFSSTKSNALTVVTKGAENRAYNIQF